MATVTGLWFILVMANNPERDCSTCIYGDNGSNSEGCPETCFEPDLTDYDPIPPKHSLEEQLLKRIEDLERENQGLRFVLATIESRLHFALHAFPPRPSFRNAPVATVPKDNTKKDNTKKDNTKASSSQ